ncbi:MAG: hypothetical protein HY013_09455 [Candidatus Solibacter usitatus]|nr:hypothetical protein [Candidatus Solibacter usitatus]
MAVFLFLAAASHTIKVDHHPLRAGCSESDAVVARLEAGQPVQVKFSLAGEAQPCFLVWATVDGKAVQGYVPASVLAGSEEFERERRAARSVEVAASPETGPAPAAPPLKLTLPAKSLPDFERVNQLLARNQNQQALGMVENLLRRWPRDPGLLALAGLAAYRGDQLGRALQFYKESLDVQPDPAVERMYRQAQRVAALDKSREATYGTRFLLRYDGTVADAALARAIVSVLEEEFARIQPQLGCRTDDRIVTIVQTREAYARITGAAVWSGAAYDGKIHIPLADQLQISPQMRQTFGHELVHACLANIGPWPTWLHEGLAQKLSGQSAQPVLRQQVRELAKAGKLPALAGLGQNWNGMSPQQAALAYGLSLVAVDLFFEHNGFGLRNLMQNPEQLKGIQDDLDRRLRE